MSHKVALSHVGGIAAEGILEKLAESGLAPDSLVLLAEETNAGNRVPFAGSHRVLQDQAQSDLSEFAVLLMPQADPVLEERAVQQGCLLVSHAIEDPAPAIYVDKGGSDPEIAYSASRLRLPGAELACLLPTLAALNDLEQIERLNIVFHRSAEFRGKAGIDELASQTVGLLNSRDIESRVYPQQIAFNLIPETTDSALQRDFQQLLGNNSCSLSLQTVNVPLFHGFAAAVHTGFGRGVSLEQISSTLRRLDNLSLSDSEVTPISDCKQSFGCAISHLQQASDQDSNLQFWLVADPMRYGLANNYVNVLDFLLKSFL